MVSVGENRVPAGQVQLKLLEMLCMKEEEKERECCCFWLHLRHKGKGGAATFKFNSQVIVLNHYIQFGCVVCAVSKLPTQAKLLSVCVAY